MRPTKTAFKDCKTKIMKRVTVGRTASSTISTNTAKRAGLDNAFTGTRHTQQMLEELQPMLH